MNRSGDVIGGVMIGLGMGLLLLVVWTAFVRGHWLF